MLSKTATISCPKDSLGEQAKGKEFEYRIIVVNKVGEGKPSDTE